jgi:hypothetical protein
MRRSSTKDHVLPLAAAGTAAAVAAGAGAYAARRRFRRRDAVALPVPLRVPAPAQTAAREPEPEREPVEEWRCACGTEYRMTGTGRHRVLWLADASESDPVLGTACVSCGRPLPSD